MKKTLLYSVLIFAFISNGLNAQNVTIPDANFKAYLISETAINTNADTEIQVSEAITFTGGIYCNSLSISDLTGIEAFTALTELRCAGNSLTTIDLSQNTALTGIACYDNNLTALDVTQNTALSVLSCQVNAITALDVSQNPDLIILTCSVNSITAIDISSNPVLIHLICKENALISLNAANGNNINFDHFLAGGNPDLECIKVDDVTWSNANWTNYKDASASFSLDCGEGLGIEDQTVISQLTIYPNPTSNSLNISTSGNIQKVEIIDVAGRLVLTDNKDIIDVSHLKKGLYYICIKTDKQTQASKFLKQ